MAELGAGSFEGREFYGVIDHERMQLNGPPNAVGSTLARRHRDPHWPAELIVVSDTGFGPDYVLDTSRTDEHSEHPRFGMKARPARTAPNTMPTVSASTSRGA